jgi:hypothetical protein
MIRIIALVSAICCFLFAALFTVAFVLNPKSLETVCFSYRQIVWAPVDWTVFGLIFLAVAIMVKPFERRKK